MLREYLAQNALSRSLVSHPEATYLALRVGGEFFARIGRLHVELGQLARLLLQGGELLPVRRRRGFLLRGRFGRAGIGPVGFHDEGAIVCEIPLIGRGAAIIDQPEQGILGIISRLKDNRIEVLLQAKIEPGNLDNVQFSPTVQASAAAFLLETCHY